MTVLPKQNRSGTVDTGTIDITGLVHPDTLYNVAAIMNAGDLADTGLSITYSLWVDGREVAPPNTWTGGTGKNRDGSWSVPTIQWGLEDGGQAIPNTARTIWVLSKPIPFGLSLTFDRVKTAFSVR